MTRHEVPEPSKYIAMLPAGKGLVVELGNRLPDEGTLRVRVRASRVSAEPNLAPSIALESNWSTRRFLNPRTCNSITSRCRPLFMTSGRPPRIRGFSSLVSTAGTRPRAHGKSCRDPLEPLREDLTVISGLSHPASRSNHGHHNADQFLTGGAIGGRGDYQNSISLDQVYAAHIGEETRFSSLVMSTDGGTGPQRKAHTMSFAPDGRPIPALHRPKHIFDELFMKNDGDAVQRLALSKSVLDHLMEDASSLRRELSKQDQDRLSKNFLIRCAIPKSRLRSQSGG